MGYKRIIAGGVYGFIEGKYSAYGDLKESYSSIGSSASKTLEGISNPSVTTIHATFNNLGSLQFLIGVGYLF